MISYNFSECDMKNTFFFAKSVQLFIKDIYVTLGKN